MEPENPALGAGNKPADRDKDVKKLCSDGSTVSFFIFSLFSCDRRQSTKSSSRVFMMKHASLCFVSVGGVRLRAGGQFSQQAAAEADKWSGEHDGKSAAAAHLAVSRSLGLESPALFMSH